MANPEHLAKLKENVRTWNAWRKENPHVKIDLREANLNGANLRDANLSEVDLRDADLSMADLSKADMSNADLSLALRGANMRGANLRGTNLNGTNLNGTNLSYADLRYGNLSSANLRDANLHGASLRGANLQDANLQGAELSHADLSRASLSSADLCNANLSSASVQYANLNNATLRDTKLWETQRAGWSIKGIICERANWGQFGENLDHYAPGEFERLYSDHTRIELFYPGGMTTFELNTLPALLHYLTAKYPGSGIRLKSVEQAGGGAKISISIDDPDPKTVEDIREEAARSQSAQIALRDDEITRLKIQKQLLLEEVFPRMLAAAPQVHITESANVAIAIGSSTVQATQTHNDAKTLLDLLGNINSHRAELELSEPQQANFEQAVQSVQTELGKSEPKRSVVSTGLKVIQDIATKVVESAAEKALTDNWHTWFTQLTVLMHYWSS